MTFLASTDLGWIQTADPERRAAHTLLPTCEALKTSPSDSDLLLFTEVLLLFTGMQAKLTYTYCFCLVCWFNFSNLTVALGALLLNETGQNGIQVPCFNL